MERRAIIKVKDLVGGYGDDIILDQVSFDVYEGEVFVVLGGSGCGKSTLMKILSGYQPPDSGHILLDRQTVHFDSPATALAGGVGMLYQDPLDMPPFRVVDNYLLGRDRRVRLNYKAARAELQEITTRYDFKLDLDAYVDSLSLGERQQLELVRLLAGGANVLILDEPTRGVDIGAIEFIHQQIVALRDQGKAILLVSVELEEILSLSDRIAVMFDGKIMGERMPQDTDEKELGLLMAGMNGETA